MLGHFVSSLVRYSRCHGFGPIGSHMFSGVFFNLWFHRPAWFLALGPLYLGRSPAWSFSSTKPFGFLCPVVFVLHLPEKQITRYIYICIFGLLSTHTLCGIVRAHKKNKYIFCAGPGHNWVLADKSRSVE